MALDREIVENEADGARQLCEEAAKLYARLVWFLEHNKTMAIPWNDAKAVTVVTVTTVTGNIDSRPFTTVEVSNAIGSLTQLRSLFENKAASQGDHLGNINKLACPLRG